MCIETICGKTLQLCKAELDRLILEFDSAPSRTAFHDIGTVAEVLVLASGIANAEPLLQQLRNAAAQWLKSGLFEDLLMARAEFAYHVALLSYLAQDAASWDSSDLDVIRDLYNGRMIARSEMPVLRQKLIAIYFEHCGIQADFAQRPARDFTRMVEKRILRARSDEFDLHVLLMCAQLLQLNAYEGRDLPRIYPQALLVQAIRSENMNWVPVLTLLCHRFFGIQPTLHRAALQSMLELPPAPGQLLSPPPITHLDSEYICRTERGLRLRSTIALALTIDSIGEPYEALDLRAAVA